MSIFKTPKTRYQDVYEIIKAFENLNLSPECRKTFIEAITHEHSKDNTDSSDN